MKKILQFGYRKSVPLSIPLVDCRVLPNPWQLEDEEARRNAVISHPQFYVLVEEGLALLREHDVIGVGCLFGVHRSKYVAQEIASNCTEQIEIEKWGRS